MTTVLPEPVAILIGDAVQAGVGLVVLRAELVLDPGHAGLGRDLGEEDRRLERLDLAEEQAPFAVRRTPVIEQQAGGLGHARHARRLASPRPAGARR